jgi:HemK-like putative methylase
MPLPACKADKFDLIISNPPYVNAESVAALPPEYLHEPELALGSGEDGLDFTRIILREAKKHLTDNGLLIVEIGHNRDDWKPLTRRCPSPGSTLPPATNTSSCCTPPTCPTKRPD